jgi:uroporphyrin-III C-methyltransferase/precorrin-2 dehydrogenase/sirohydrochlorin ferrochelatase
MRFLPLGIDVRDRECVVVGGGPVGTRKALTMAHAGAAVRVVSPDVTEELRVQIDAGRIGWLQENFKPDHLAGAFLVIMATNNHSLNAAGALLARQECALACDASSGVQTQVIFGALLQNDGLTIATFSDGMDPAHSRRTRDEIAGFLTERKSVLDPE